MEGIRTTRIVGIPCLDLDDLANDIAGHQIFFGIEDRFYPSSGVAVIDRVETYHPHIVLTPTKFRGDYCPAAGVDASTPCLGGVPRRVNRVGMMFIKAESELEMCHHQRFGGATGCVDQQRLTDSSHVLGFLVRVYRVYINVV